MATPRPSEEQWELLTTMIELAERLQVVFVACADKGVEAALRERLRRFCEETGRPLRAPAPDQYVLDWLFDLQQERPPSGPDGEHAPVMFLPLPKDKEVFVLHRLNENRDNLRRDLRGVLCVVGDKELPRVAPYEAPDFWDVRAKLLELATLTGPPAAVFVSTTPVGPAVGDPARRDISPPPSAVPVPTVTKRPRRRIDATLIAPLVLLVVLVGGLVLWNIVSQRANVRACAEGGGEATQRCMDACSDIEGSHMPSCTRAGEMIEKSAGGRVEEEDRALSFYKRACEGGDAAGCLDLGQMYEGGKAGLSKDKKRAVELYRRACDGGNQYGCSALVRGRGGLAENMKKAVELYQRACDGGDTWACDQLNHVPP